MEPKKVNDPDELGGWRINGRLGEGGFGTVFLAEKGAQKAAIKVIRQEFVEEVEARSRLATEAEVLSKLADPAIGKILDSDLKGEIPWIATEFINGPTLADKIKYEGPLEEIAWFRLAANIFHAIISANQLGIIHKDIKPSNIILGETGNKLIDFGIAHISGQTRTMVFGDREGSIPYSSPEHFTIRANPKMDVFSTAATLAYAAKGESIWEGEDDLQLMRSINDDPPNLAGLSENQANYLLPLLEKNPSDRPSSLEAHQSALDFIEFLLGDSRKPTTLNKRRKTSRIMGNKARVTVSALAVLASAILFISLLAGQLIPNEIKSWFTNTPNLTIDQLEKASSCAGLLSDGEFQIASNVCREIAELGDANSQHALGFALDELGNNQEALFWIRKAAAQKVPLSLSWLAYDAIEKEEYSEALEWAKQSAELGELNGIQAVGLAYGYLEQYELAAEWYEKVWKLGDAWGLILLGYHYRVDDPNEIEAEKWLKLAATTQSNYESEGAFDYAEFLREQGKRSAEFCLWYKKSADAKYKEAEYDAVESFKKYCSDLKTPLTPIN